MKAETYSAIAACLAVLLAILSWYYNKEITKGLLSLYDVQVKGERVAPTRLKINFLFLFSLKLINLTLVMMVMVLYIN